MATTNLEAVFGKISELKEAARKAVEEALKPAREALMRDFHAAFEKHPEVKAIAWVQYTPYFNDGEPCEFGVRDAYAADSDEHDLDGSPYDWNYKVHDDFPNPAELDEEMMEGLFGDHVKVTIKPGGDFEVEEHSHD